MQIHVEWEIVKQHKQKYCNSCIPSAVEMVLKLLGKADINFYCFQDNWSLICVCIEKIGISDQKFKFFQKIRFPGMAFEQRLGNASEILDIIDREICSDRLVIISLQNPHNSDSHIWIIYGKENDGNYLGFSRDYCEDEILHLKKAGIDLRSQLLKKGGDTDILVYKQLDTDIKMATNRAECHQQN